MTVREDDLDDLLPDDEDDGAGTVLASFAVTARFRRTAATAEQAEREVRTALRGGLFEDVRVEPREPDGRWAVDVRFVLVSLDGETAVAGVHESLRLAGSAADEVWLAERLV